MRSHGDLVTGRVRRYRSRWSFCLGQYWLMIWQQDEFHAFWPYQPSGLLEYWWMQSLLDSSTRIANSSRYAS